MLTPIHIYNIIIINIYNIYYTRIIGRKDGSQDTMIPGKETRKHNGSMTGSTDYTRERTQYQGRTTSGKAG